MKPVAGVANRADRRQLTKADDPLNPNLTIQTMHAACHAQTAETTGASPRNIPFSGAASTDSESPHAEIPARGAVGNNTIEDSGHGRPHKGYRCAGRRSRPGRLPCLRIPDRKS